MTKSKFCNRILFFIKFSVNWLMQYKAADIEHHSRAWIPASIKMTAFFDASLERHADIRCDMNFLRSFDSSTPADFTVLDGFGKFAEESFEMRMDLMGRFSYEYPMVVTETESEYFDCNVSRYWFISEWRKYCLRKSIQITIIIFKNFRAIRHKTIFTMAISFGEKITQLSSEHSPEGSCTKWRVMRNHSNFALRSVHVANAFVAAAKVEWNPLYWKQCVKAESSTILMETSDRHWVVYCGKRAHSNKLWKFSRIRWQKSLFRWVENFCMTESATIKLHEVPAFHYFRYFYLLSRIRHDKTCYCFVNTYIRNEITMRISAPHLLSRRNSCKPMLPLTILCIVWARKKRRILLRRGTTVNVCPELHTLLYHMAQWHMLSTLCIFKLNTEKLITY